MEAGGMSRECTLLYVHGSEIGYGRLGVHLSQELGRKGVKVYDHLEPPEEVKAKLSSGDRKVMVGREHKMTRSIGWVSVPTHARGWYDGQWPWVFTMWEADWLPEAFREALHHFECVVVPSPQNQELFGSYHPNVQLATLGVDPDIWHLTERPTPAGTFDVLIGGSGPRKGLDLALEAFCKAFPPGWHGDGPVPRIVLKSPRADLGYPDNDFRSELCFPPEDQLLVINGRLTAEDEVGLYARSHVYIQPSRGEGFGLQPLQAVAQGLPTILTDAHGHESFAHLGLPVTATKEKAGYFIYGDHPEMRWWRPSVDEMVDHLRSVYENYEDHVARAADSAATVAERFTWSDCADQVLTAVGDAMGEPYDGSGSWQEPEAKLYWVRVTRRWTADIAGVQYRFEPGQDYYEPADVKRIMFECGLLDPACLERVHTTSDGETFDDHGLTPDQAKKIPGYTAAHSFCPECGQRVNGSPTRADLLWALRRAARGDDQVAIMAELGQ